MHNALSHRYVVRLDGEDKGFGDNLDEAIAYASDANEDARGAEVWMTGTEIFPDLQKRVWPDLPADE
jgi:hypothetical protein